MSVGVIGVSSGIQPSMPDGALAALKSGKTSNLWENVSVSLSPGTYVVSGSGATQSIGVKFFAPNSKTSAVAYAGKPATLRITKAETFVQVATRWTSPKSISSSNVRNAYTANVGADTNYSRYAGYVTPDMTFSSIRIVPQQSYSKLVKAGFDDIAIPNGEWGTTGGNFSNSYVPQSLAVSPVTGNFIAGAYSGIGYVGSGFNTQSAINFYSSDEYWSTVSWCQEAYDDGAHPFVALGPNSSSYYGTIAILTDPTNGNPAQAVANRNTSNSWTSFKSYTYDASTRSYYFVGGYMSTARYSFTTGQWTNMSYVDSNQAGTGIVKTGSTFVVTSTNNRIYTSTDFATWTYHTPTVRFSNGTTGTLSNAQWAGVRKEGNRLTIWTSEGDAYYQDSFSTSGIWERAEVIDIPIRNMWVAQGSGMTQDWSINRSLYSNINDPVPTIHAMSSTNLYQDSYTCGSLVAAPLGINYSIYSGA